MAVLELKRSNLIIGVNDTILIHNLDQSTTTDIKLVQSNPKIKENMCMVAFSKTCENFAIVTDQKVLHIYFRTDSSYDCIKTYSMSRAASAMKFSENCNKLVIADKTGDVYLAERKCEWHPNLILGHLSMLLDVLLTPDDKCIISCDRDEKIRVSAYPDTFNIVAYCLGHEEFVSSLDILTEYPDILFSASGDATIRAWYYPTGQQLLCVKLSSAIISLKVNVIGEKIIAIALLYKSCDVQICSISFTAANFMECNILQTIKLPAEATKFTSYEKNLYFLGSNYLVHYRFDTEKLQYIKVEDVACPMVQEIVSQNKCADLHSFTTSLFKKQYNNVEEYHKRKQMRMNKDLAL